MAELRTYRPDGSIKSGKNTSGGSLAEGSIIIKKASPTVSDEIDAAGAATDAMIGVVADAAIADGSWGKYQCGGLAKALAGGTIAVGDRVTSDASGHCIAASAGNAVIGVANTAGTAAALFELDLDALGAEMPG